MHFSQRTSASKKHHLIQNYMTEKIQNLLQYSCQDWLNNCNK
jgi:hypothetical protein